MKIKSHTGEMVEARVGMVVNCGHSFMKPEQVRFARAKIIYCDGDEFVQVEHDNGFNFVNAELCTMLHCPFQVGDSIEHEYPILGWKDMGHKIENEEMLKMLNALNAVEVIYRHANPSLRDAPEYKP